MRWCRDKQEIRSFSEDTARTPALASSYRGIQAIPVDQIVGSVGRAHELRANFLPVLWPHGDYRFQAIKGIMERGETVPPIDVYMLNGRYYVVDGNHRVAAALKIGQAALDAVVTEFFPNSAWQSTAEAEAA